ncbi:MAG: hypothetical protein JWQ29_1447 [Phenylobacterium sp.]|nr:hypothetical protein [Phenylobacterium sp.]
MTKAAPWLTGLLLTAACATAQAATPSGVWGGDRLVATFSETGARLQADCGQGEIAAPVRPDRSGRFTGSGTFETFTGGPQLVEGPAPASAARFSGRVRGDTLSLTIRTAADPAPRRYTLTRGVRPKLVRCL